MKQIENVCISHSLTSYRLGWVWISEWLSVIETVSNCFQLFKTDSSDPPYWTLMWWPEGLQAFQFPWVQGQAQPSYQSSNSTLYVWSPQHLLTSMQNALVVYTLWHHQFPWLRGMFWHTLCGATGPHHNLQLLLYILTH